MLVSTCHPVQAILVLCIRGINDNRRQCVIQNHYFTYQRRGNHELQVQALNIIVVGLQNQINNLSSGGGGGGGGAIGTM